MDEPILKNDNLNEDIPAPQPEPEEVAAVETDAAPIEEAPQAEPTSDSEIVDTAEDAEEVDEDDMLAHAFENYTEEAPKPKRWPIVVLSVLLVVVLVAGLLWSTGVFDHFKKQPGGQGGSTDVSDLDAMTSENFTVTTGMLAFDIEYWYQNFAGYYGSYLSYFGLDTTKSLKEQTAYSGEGSWFDYFASYARNDAEYILLMNEAAKKNGITMGAAAKKMVDKYVADVDLSTFHNGVSKEDVEAFWTLYYTASTQENAIYNSINITEDAVNALYAKSPATYQVCDYVYFNVSASTENASEIVDTLAACTDAESFRQKVVQYLVDAKKYENAEKAAAAYDANAVKKAAAYTADDGISDWLFAADTKVGTTRTVTGEDSSVTVYMLTAAPTRNTQTVVNVRHILITKDTYGSDDAAKKKADELLAAWQKGAATAESFGELAAEHTEDSNGAAGGLYTGVTQGQMVETFNDWCFDSARKIGDTGIVKTDYGYHVMYFEGAQETWYFNAWSTLVNEEYGKQYEALQKAYPITINEENISKIEL